MDIEYIREFVVLADIGGFQKAAEQLYISQSSLSQHIKRLEMELGARLFNRTTKMVELSDFGKIFLPYATQISNLQEQYTEKLKSALKNSQKSITIGSMELLDLYNITDILAKFKKKNPEYSVNVIQGKTKYLESLLRRNQCSMIVIRELSDQENVEFNKVTYAVDPLVAVLPANHPLAGLDHMSVANLKDEPFIMFSERSLTYNLCTQLCKEAGFEPNIAFTFGRTGNVLNMIEKEMGVSIMTRKMLQEIPTHSIAAVPIEPAVSVYVNILYPKADTLPLAARLFLDCALEAPLVIK